MECTENPKLTFLGEKLPVRRYEKHSVTSSPQRTVLTMVPSRSLIVNPVRRTSPLPLRRMVVRFDVVFGPSCKYLPNTSSVSPNKEILPEANRSDREQRFWIAAIL